MLKNVSASKINTFNFCKKQFKLKYIDKVEEKKSQLAQEGIDIHEVFFLAYKDIDINYMFRLNTKVGPRRGPVYYYLKELALGKLTESNDLYKKHVKNWALYFAYYWHSLRNKYSNNEVARYFTPVMLEEKIEDKENNLIGIIDVMLRVPVNGEEYLFVLDYKTGNPPIAVMRGENKLPTKYSRQLHLYAWLARVATGEEFKKMRIGILWTSYYNTLSKPAHYPFSVEKKVNKRSMDSMKKHVGIVSAAQENPDSIEWTPIYDKYMCEGLYRKPPNPCGYCDICYRRYELEAMKPFTGKQE